MNTVCKHCGESFDGGVEIIGQPGARLASLLHKLGSHMNTKHPDTAQGMEVIGADFMGWLFLANFKSGDEQLNLYCDQRRWHIHQQTLAARYSDEKLTGLVRDISSAVVDKLMGHLRPGLHDTFRAQVEVEVLGLATQIRDELEEPSRYATAQAPSVLV